MRFIILATMVLAGCGYSARDNEMIGQVKKVVHATPLICPNRYDVDISLGVIRGGVGSMSSQDVWLTIDDPSALAVLRAANESGSIVKINYDIARVVFCSNDHLVTKAEIAK